MRQERMVQASLFDFFAGHEIGRELQAMSAWLDDHGDPLGLAARTCAGTGSRRRAATVCRRRACCAARCSSNAGS